MRRFGWLVATLVDRVEWLVIPDLQRRVAAIQKGEVDLIDQLPHDGGAGRRLPARRPRRPAA